MMLNPEHPMSDPELHCKLLAMLVHKAGGEMTIDLQTVQDFPQDQVLFIDGRGDRFVLRTMSHDAAIEAVRAAKVAKP